ncbi:hypothetical protein EYF80_051948 [Liparis tanakae]|uniref:Uncharacterized protein n=1 Tax=Liparis tanakae TaxID=230148 RepID=A0A4Z2F9I5_9TELE|nr:hypothetical protein EYF80_051948 [Liparis tanakae]
MEGSNRCMEGPTDAWRVQPMHGGSNRCMEGSNRCMEGPYNRCMEGSNRCMEGSNRCMEGSNRCMEGSNRCMEACDCYCESASAKVNSRAPSCLKDPEPGATGNDNDHNDSCLSRSAKQIDSLTSLLFVLLFWVQKPPKRAPISSVWFTGAAAWFLRRSLRSRVRTCKPCNDCNYVIAKDDLTHVPEAQNPCDSSLMSGS